MFPPDLTRGRASKHGPGFLAAAIAALCLFGCGSSHRLLAEQLPRAADGTAARVGSQKIDQAAYDHLFATEAEAAGEPIPVPPDFALCVNHLRATARRIGIKTPPRSLLLPKCRERYEELQEKTLGRLLVDTWVLAAARELGLTASAAQVRAKLAESERARFPDPAQFKRYLARTGMTTGELEAEARAEVLAGAIRRAVLRRVGPITRAKMKTYYEAHPGIESVPATWDLEIVSAESLKDAARLKREIASGRSFARVAAGLVHQPVGSRDGRDAEYGAIGHYDEPKLDRAIVTARYKVLKGPLKVTFNSGSRWFVFRVAKMKPRFQKPFPTVEASIEKVLPARIRREALSAFTSSWGAKWKPRTSCAAGYEAPLCNRAKSDPGQALLDVLR